MLTHCVSPIHFCFSVIVPIPKNKRANKCHYRAIAISYLLGKIIGNIIFEDINLFIYGSGTIWL